MNVSFNEDNQNSTDPLQLISKRIRRTQNAIKKFPTVDLKLMILCFLCSQSPYADVPNDMFYCHLCKKHMWDAISFENHIKGRTHLMMREGIEESYRLKANMIRQEAKIAETLKSIELDRLKRMGKSGKRGMMEYCTMCDLSFHGHLSTHRKSEGHLQLKKFLHPKCSECVKEFPTRIEYDTHLLSPEHLKKAAEKNTKVGDRKLLQSLQILTEEEELKDVRPPQKRKKKVAKKEEEGEKKEGEEGAEGEKKENGEGAEGEEIKKEEEAEEEGDHEHDETKEGDQIMEDKDGEEYEEVPLPVDPEDCILDFEDGTEIPIEVEAKLPKYNWTRAVGAKLIKQLECIECRLCGRFFDNEKTAEVHTRTVYHHRNFLKFITEKSADSKIAQKRAAAAAEEVERKKKRLEEAEAAEKTADEAAPAEEGGDLYDPSEATGDDEDVDMAANGEQNGDAANESAVKEEPAAETEKMEAEETATPAVEVKTEEDAVEQPTAPEPPVISESPTPAPAATPAKRAAAAKSTTTTPRNTPARNRGRGRYNRY